MSKKLATVLCKCNRNVSLRQLHHHLLDGKCTATVADQSQLVSLYHLYKSCKRAWLIRDGNNAMANYQWIISVMNGTTQMDDWSFVAPRKKGVVRPHMRLYDRIKAHDSSAVIEYAVNIDGTYKRYDIYSPKINALIEMHGRVFHDLTMTKSGLRNIVTKKSNKRSNKGSLCYQ